MWKALVNWVLNLFGKANDWYPVWSEQGIWQFLAEKEIDKDLPGTQKACNYIIEFSSSLRKYRLIKSGHNAEYHVMLAVANIQLVKLTRELE